MVIIIFKIQVPVLVQRLIQLKLPEHGIPDMGAYESPLANPVGVEENETGHPSEYALYQNYPNPFNPTTNIEYEIPAAGFVTLKVYNMLGQEVATVVNEERDAGSYQVQFDGTGLSSGVYFYRIQAGDFVDAKKLLLIK
jgi:hypothetical protein